MTLELRAGRDAAAARGEVAGCLPAGEIFFHHADLPDSKRSVSGLERTEGAGERVRRDRIARGWP